MKTYRIQDYKAAKTFVDNYMQNKMNYAIIHYSCQGFYSTSDGTNPRIVAICILFPQSMQKHLFSLTSVAEIRKIDVKTADETMLDSLEQEMLKDFYTFVKSQKREYVWLHWNMRDHVFGFTAIAQRYYRLNQKKKRLTSSIMKSKRTLLCCSNNAMVKTMHNGHINLIS